MTSRRNNILAGFLVLAAIASATGFTVWLGGYSERLGKRQYLVEFDLSEGVPGLDPGSVVTIGGEEVGSVISVSFFPNPQVADPTRIRVVISVDVDFNIRQGAVAYLVAPLLGGSSAINFNSLGEQGGVVYSTTDPIDGRMAPPSFLAGVGIGTDEVGEVKGMIEGASNFIGKMNVIADDTGVVVADAKAKWPEWKTSVDNVTSDVEKATSRGPELAESLDAGVAEIRELLATAQSYLDDNRAKVDEAVENIRAGSDDAKLFLERLEGELADKAAQFLERGNEALTTAQASLEKVDAAVDEEMPSVRRTLANVRLATDQLAATTSEVRRAPWRLLFRPDTREMEFELLYDAARSYAGAVSDLRNSSETMSGSIEAMTTGGSVDRERVERLVEQLEQSFEIYKATEEHFLQMVSDHAAGD